MTILLLKEVHLLMVLEVQSEKIPWRKVGKVCRDLELMRLKVSLALMGEKIPSPLN